MSRYMYSLFAGTVSNEEIRLGFVVYEWSRPRTISNIEEQERARERNYRFNVATVACTKTKEPPFSLYNGTTVVHVCIIHRIRVCSSDTVRHNFYMPAYRSRCGVSEDRYVARNCCTIKNSPASSMSMPQFQIFLNFRNCTCFVVSLFSIVVVEFHTDICCTLEIHALCLRLPFSFNVFWKL